MQNYYKLVLHLGWWKQYGKGVPNEIMYSNDSVHRKRERFPLLFSNCFENQCISYTYKQRVLRAESIYIARLKKTSANHRGCGNCSSTRSTRKYFYINKLVFQIYQPNRLKVVNNPIKLYQYIYIYISLCVCVYIVWVLYLDQITLLYQLKMAVSLICLRIQNVQVRPDTGLQSIYIVDMWSAQAVHM